MRWDILRKSGKKKERGSILAMAAVGAVSLVFAAGLAIDISHFYSVGTDLQNAADAAALAGVSALNHTAAGITRAADRAVATMNSTEFNGATVNINRSDVRFAVNLSEFDGTGTGRSEASAQASPQNIRFVRVKVPTTAVTTYFASQILGSTFNIDRSAVAGESSTSVGVNTVCNPLPLALIEDDSTSCPNNLEVVGPCGNTTQYTPGCTYNVHLAPPCSADATQYIVLDEPSERCTSTDNWNKRIALGLDCITACETLEVNEHITASSIRQGVNSRFDSFSGGLSPSVAPPDLNITNNITYANYKAQSPSTSPTNPGKEDRRIVIFPIVKLSDVHYLDGGETQRVEATKFGVFFLRKRATGSGSSVADIQIEYINESIMVGDGSFSPSGCSSGKASLVTVPVLYR